MASGTKNKPLGLGKFGVFVALILSSVVAGGVGYSAGLHSVSNNKTRTQNEHGAKDHTARPNAERQTIGTFKSVDVKIQSDNEAKYAQQDLVAQQQMATWTTNMGLAAFIGVVLSGFSIWLIFITLKETRKAANSATKTHEAFVKVERAYLLPRIGDVVQWVVDGKAGKTVFINVTNIGKGSCVFHSIEWEWFESIPRFEDISLHGPPRNELIEANVDYEIGYIRSNKRMFEREILIAKITYTSALAPNQTSWLVYEVHKGMAESVRPNDWPKDT